ncbi:hypothetical protein NIES4073_58430 [Kalymmatonema gypsitolerans NIES-4073]|nr:hypothetical protein NIES4073_58430 [Scytonema sp. NIES-4073]
MGYLLDTCVISDFVKGEENTLKQFNDHTERHRNSKYVSQSTVHYVGKCDRTLYFQRRNPVKLQHFASKSSTPLPNTALAKGRMRDSAGGVSLYFTNLQSAVSYHRKRDHLPQLVIVLYKVCEKFSFLILQYQNFFSYL